ncbi:MAG: TonB-dependent receptor [Acidobacteria bacterium]|nr:TonB-dependent receptor [Acidobacteriota bacterium]
MPFGGFYDSRFGAYIQDNWKITPSFSASVGVRYVFDSNIANNDLPRTPTLAAFHPDLAGKVDRPNLNFAPQAGFAWDVRGNGKTVIRGGAGIFYETNIINNALFDRPLNLPPGLGNDTPVLNAGSPKLLNPATGACIFDITKYSATPGNCNGPLNLLGQPLKNVIAAAQNMQTVLQQITAGLAANYPPKGVAPLFDQTLDASSLIYNKYQRPYGIMFNIGVQRELKPGLVLSVDYLRNRGVHFNQGINLNRIGAANTLNPTLARQIISDVNDSFKCPANATAAAINCAITAGATIGDYADFGLDAGSALDGFAFSGVNRNYRNISVIAPVGLSTYNALSVNLRGRLGKFWIVKDATTVVSYSLSRFASTAGDQDFLAGSFSNDSPTKFYGPTGLDRTHQFTVSFLTELPWGIKFSTTTRLASGLPVTILLPQHSGSGAGEIFFTDLDGDGTTRDLLPGTNVGAFGRGVGVGRLNSLITDFNGTVQTAFTPAARALVTAGLFSEAQLRALGATVNGGEVLALAPAGQVPVDRFSNTDVRISKVIKFYGDGRVRVEPMVEIFNLFNIGNYDTPGNFLSGTLDASPGSINGTLKTDRVNRYGLGSGSFAPGIPRAFQFGFRLEF